jgi:hypothetical protein
MRMLIIMSYFSEELECKADEYGHFAAGYGAAGRELRRVRRYDRRCKPVVQGELRV